MTDRRTLRRQYKETAKPAGLFGVHNLVDDMLFVGMSPDLPSMLNRQRFQLENGMHPDRALQRDCNRLGASAFSFEILDQLEPAPDTSRDDRKELTALHGIWPQTRDNGAIDDALNL